MTAAKSSISGVVSTQLHMLLMMIAHEYLNAACAEEDSKRKKSDVAVDSLIRYLNTHYTGVRDERYDRGTLLR